MTTAHEDYLRTIYSLVQSGVRPTTSTIAGRMDVAPASATNMLKKLSRLGLVNYEPYRGATLTKTGRRIALEMVRHHRLLELFLSEVLGMPWDQVDVEADRLEHVISEDLEEAIARKLGYPTLDPHGDPIPAPDLTLPPSAGVPLTTLEVGERGCIARVLAQEPARLRYLGSLGLYPSQEIQLLQREPFAGPLRLQIGAGQVILADNLAEQILVQKCAHAEEEKV